MDCPAFIDARTDKVCGRLMEWKGEIVDSSNREYDIYQCPNCKNIELKEQR